MKILALLTTSALLCLSVLAQAPVQRNPWSTNITGNHVLGQNNLIVTNIGSGTNWVYYGVLTNTVARLIDITNVTGNYVLRSGDFMYGALQITNSAGAGGLSFAVDTNSIVVTNQNVGIGTNTPAGKLSIEGNRTGKALEVNGTQLVVTNGNVGIGISDPTNRLSVGNGNVAVTGGDLIVREDDDGFNAAVLSASTSTGTLTLNTAGSARIALIASTSGSSSMGFSSLSKFISGADGNMGIMNNAGTDFQYLYFGAGGSYSPAIYTYTNNTTLYANAVPHLAVRKADGSGFAPIVAMGIRLDNSVSTTRNAMGIGASDLQYGVTNATITASGANSIVLGGTNNTSSGPYSSSSGCAATAGLYGSKAHASGAFAYNSDAQQYTLVSRRTIQKNGTATGTGVGITNDWNGLYLDGEAGGAIKMVLTSVASLQTNTVWTFKGQVSAFAVTNYAGTYIGQSAGYEFYGVIDRVINSTTLRASSVTTIYEADSDWDCRVVADDTNDALVIEFYPDDACPRVSANVIIQQTTVGP